jgi:metallo-beta-lactamase class B
VKFLLNSHAHFDHAGGLAELKKVTGAKFVASERDAPLLRSGGDGDFRFGDTLTFPPIAPDQIVHDGEALQLGNQIMIAHLTPGHTKGCTTWTTKIRAENKVYAVVFVGSQSAIDYKFVGQESYAGIFLASHGSFFHLVEKHERWLRGDSNAFIDPDGYKTYLRESERDFRNKFGRQKSAQE